MRMLHALRTRTALAVVVITASVMVTALATPAFAAPGDLDSSFGSNGKVKWSFTTGRDSAQGVAVQSGGKILVAGQTDGDTFAVARFLSNGTPDSGFGVGGLSAVTSLGSSAVVYATSVAVQGDGKILVAGEGDPGAVVVRMNTNGSLDGGFGNGGIAAATFLDHGEGADDVAIQANGKIVIAGYAYNASQRQFFAVARFTKAGQLDTTFSGNGMATLGFASGDSHGSAVVIQPSDQKILAIGWCDSKSNGTNIAVIRLNTDGTPDTTFAGDGFAGYSDGAGATGKDGEVDSAGHIIVAGYGSEAHKADFALIEIGPAGHLNGNFGTGGKVLTDFAGDFDYGEAMALQSDDKIVVAGYSWQGSSHEYDFALARYKTTGKLDKKFGTNGLVTTSFGNDDDASDVAIQSDGRIVVVGITQTPSSGQFALARYLA